MPVKSKLFLEPRAGLANRLLAILSCIRLARLFDRELVLVWRRTASCFCDWRDLFEADIPCVQPNAHNVSKDNIVTIDASDVLHARLPPRLDLGNMEGDVLVESNCLVTYAGDSSRSDDFWCYDPILTDISEEFQKLGLNPVVQDLFEQSRGKIRAFDTTGLHVRRGTLDREDSKSIFNKVTDAAYRVAVEEIHGDDKNNPIFLASDAEESATYFSDVIPNRLLMHRKRSYNKNSEHESIQDALVDLLGLAECKCVIGNAKSTFCYLAAVRNLKPYFGIAGVTPTHVIIDAHTYTNKSGDFEHRVNRLTLPLTADVR